MRRIYQPFEKAFAGFHLTLSDEAHHHLVKVLRADAGEKLIIFNGRGESWIAKISDISKKQTGVELIEKLASQAESSFKIHLAQAVSKGDRMDFVMQKATELGVTEITPILTERGNVKLDKQRWEKKQTHWEQIIISAAEQSARDVLPLLNPVIELSDWFLKSSHTPRFILSPYAEKSFSTFEKPEQATILIGPEGGLTENEIKQAVTQYGFHAIRLGPRVLRTETAALSAISVLQALWGDLS